MNILHVLLFFCIFLSIYSHTNDNNAKNNAEIKEDYYVTLGVPRTATFPEIRKAFKKLSLKYHPDKNKDKPVWAKNMFIKIAADYETLSNKDKRAYYDKYGHDKDPQEDGVSDFFGDIFGKDFFGNDFFKNFGEGGGRGGEGGGGGSGSDSGKGFEDYLKLFESYFMSFFGNFGEDIFGSGKGGNGNTNDDNEIEDEDKKYSNQKFFHKTNVTNIHLNNWSKINNKKDKAWFILFYRPRDYKQVVKTWKKLGDKAKGLFYIAAVNCYSDTEICEEYRIPSTPLVLHIPDSSSDDNMHSKGSQIYNGNYNWEEIFTHGAIEMSSFVYNITQDNYKDFTTQYSSISLLFTSRKVTSPIYKLLSTLYKNSIVFGEVHERESQIVQQFNIKKFPTLIFYSNGKWQTYNGDFDIKFLKKFFKKNYNSMVVNEETSNRRSKAAEIKLLDEANFKKYCNRNEENFTCAVYLSKNDKKTLFKQERKLLKNLILQYEDTHKIKVFVLYSLNFDPNFMNAFEVEDRNSNMIILTKRKEELRYVPIKLNTIEDILKEFDNILTDKTIKPKLCVDEIVFDKKSDL